MKAYLKNPNLYFMLVPAAAALWVVLVMTVSLPAAQKKWEKSQVDYNKAEDLMAKIADIDRDRLNYKVNEKGGGKFDYSTAIEETASLVKIPSSAYSLTVRKPVRSGGKDKQSADMTIDMIDIERLARFISQMLLRWADVECYQLSIDRLPAGKNAWKATIKFVYTPK